MVPLPHNAAVHRHVGPANAASGLAGQIIDRGSVTSHYQPIVSLRMARIAGVEALCRGIDPTNVDARLIPPDRLLALAAEESLSAPFEVLMRAKAVENFAGFASGPARCQPPLLFMNYDASLRDPSTAPAALLAQAQAAGVDASRIVVEILESRVDDTQLLADTAQALRAAGFLIAMDDMGQGHSNLDRISLIRPDILKLDRGLLVDIETNFHRQETVKALCHLATRIGALVVAEGIETAEQAVRALELGADMLQGYYFARPAPIDSLAFDTVEQRLRDVAIQYKARTVYGIQKRRKQHRTLQHTVERLRERVSRAGPDSFQSALQRELDNLADFECAYVVDATGKQVTDTVVRASALHKVSALHQPAPRGSDHSLKQYFYALRAADLPRYITDPYVSIASGNVCRTVSVPMLTDSGSFVLCVDMPCPDSERIEC